MGEFADMACDSSDPFDELERSGGGEGKQSNQDSHKRWKEAMDHRKMREIENQERRTKMTEDVQNIHAFGTIRKLNFDTDMIDICVQDDRTGEVTIPMKFGKAAKEWYLKHKDQFPIGQVIELDYRKYRAGPILGKMKPAQQPPTPAQRSNEMIINEKLKAVGCAPNPENKDYSERQFTSSPAVQTIGSYDPGKVTVKMRTTCPTPTQYENIAIEVEGPDPETCRRALIESYSVLGNAHPATKDFITAHIKRVLLKEQ